MPKARLGIQAFATDTGLGIQTRSIYKHLKPDKTMLVDLSAYNHMPVHEDWYPDAIRTNGFPTDAEIDVFLDGLDVVLVCETPLNYQLFERARARGIKTVLQYNYEFLDYVTAAELRRPSLPRPDVFAAPTQWNIRELQRVGGAQLLPVPISVQDLPQRSITQARRFFHTAGRPAVHDRNGTLDFIAAACLAAQHMPDAEFIIYCQQPTIEIERALVGTTVKLVGAVEDPADIYRHGDVLVLPRRYGGLCLPAQEAVGCGIPVLMTNVSPNSSWLPADWLVQVKPRIGRFMARTAINVYSVNVRALAARMLTLYRDDAAVIRMHEQAKTIAAGMTWDAQMPTYEAVLGLEEHEG